MHSATFAGISCLDTVFVTDGHPAEDSKTRAGHSYVQTGGFAANAAMTYALLGGRATLHTKVGAIGAADLIKRDMSFNGIDVRDHADAEFSPPYSAILINARNGARTVVSSVKGTQSATMQKDMEVDGSLLFVDGFYGDVARPLIDRAKKRGLPIVFDADKWRDDAYEDFIPLLDVAIAGNEFMPPGCRSHEDVFAFFKARGVGKVAITRGSDNILWEDGSVSGEIAVSPVEVVDTLGAGDILHGAFCYFYHDHSFSESLEKASQIATLSVRFYGTREWISHYTGR